MRRTHLSPLFAILAAAAVLFSTMACNLSLGDSPAPGGEANVLFQDDFSKSDSGWATLEDETGLVAYENGGLRFLVNATDYDYWSIAGLDLQDLHVEVDATKVSGPDDNDFGIICRYVDENNFYGLLVSSDGYYGISKMKDGEHTVISGEGMQFSDKIRTGAATNRIGADCIGSRLVLYINGEELISVEDSEFAKGDIGLLAGTFGTAGTEIVFDNLQVTKPAAAQAP